MNWALPAHTHTQHTSMKAMAEGERIEGSRRRRKILHVVASMGRGGVETWLMHVMRNINRNEFELHFLVHTNSEAAYDREICSLGGRVHHCVNPKNLFRYASRFRSIIDEYGPFDAIHSHVYLYSGFVARLAQKAGIPIRIAHSHTATKAPKWMLPRRLYEEIMKAWIRRYATHWIGVSEKALEALFGSLPAEPSTLLYCGLDFKGFLHATPKAEMKQRLGIAAARKVIGQVGRFVPVKNHAFTVEFFEQAVAEGLDGQLVFVGDGPLLPSIRALIESRGLSDRCTFAGAQGDIV